LLAEFKRRALGLQHSGLHIVWTKGDYIKCLPRRDGELEFTTALVWHGER